MSSMTSRDRIVLSVGVAIAIVVAFWLLLISPRQDTLSNLDTQLDQANSQLATVRATLAAEEAAKRSFSRSYAELTRLGEAVPADDDVPSLLYQIQSAANNSGVDFRTIALSAAGTSGGASASAAPTSLPPGAAVGPAGFPSENFTFSFQGNFFRLSNFFERLQRLVIDDGSFLTVSGRLLTLNSITLAAATSGFPRIDAEVNATAYIVPASQGLLNGATAAGPGSGIASSTSSSGSGAATTSTTATTPATSTTTATTATTPGTATTTPTSPTTTTTGGTTPPAVIHP